MEERKKSVEPEQEKLEYEKPAIVYHEKIEARAAVCTGASSKANTAACSGPIVS